MQGGVVPAAWRENKTPIPNLGRERSRTRGLGDPVARLGGGRPVPSLERRLDRRPDLWEENLVSTGPLTEKPTPPEKDG